MELKLRPLKLSDLAELEAIQTANPSASQWNPVDYLAYPTTVAEVGGAMAGFLCILELPDDEAEILNLAVAPKHKRQGVATALLNALNHVALHLDVRESNASAIAFYKRHGFVKVGHRRKYYQRPVEDAIMMSRRR